MLQTAVLLIRMQVHIMEPKRKEKVVLSSIDVDAVFEMLKNSTPYFNKVSYTQDDIVTQCPFHGFGNEGIAADDRIVLYYSARTRRT